MNPLIKPMTSIGASILFDQDAAKETNEHSAVKAVVATEQNAKDERCKGVGRDQPGRLGLRSAKTPLLQRTRRSFVAASWRKMMPKTRKTRELRRNVFG